MDQCKCIHQWTTNQITVKSIILLLLTDYKTSFKSYNLKCRKVLSTILLPVNKHVYTGQALAHARFAH